MPYTATSDVLARSFQDLWGGVIGFIPELIIAIVIFIVGWIIGALLGRVVDQIIKAVKLDSALRSAGLEAVLSRGGFSLNSGRFLGGLVKWFIIIVFLIASLDVLGLSQVNAFLKDVVLLYLPQVIVAVLILLVAVVIAEVMQNIVVGSAKAAHLHAANFLGAITKWAIWVFAALAALFQLGVAATFIQTLFTGIIVAFALAFGLAFGLGGQSAASGFLDKMRREISEK
jgi:small-conductance mechanosensitive channel